MRALVALVFLASCTARLDLGEHASIDRTPCGENSGGCTPGRYCNTTSCDACFCDTNHHWHCSKTCATTAEGCPGSEPKDGVACTGDLRCAYDSTCGTIDVASCVGGKWLLFPGVCASPVTCPPEDSEPPIGKPCPVDGLKCQFKNKCGALFTAYCDGTHAWSSDAPPCPDTGCPAAPPTSGTTCGAPSKCSWKNECGTVDNGACVDGTWYVDHTCFDTTECGLDSPSQGAACKTDGLPCTWKCSGGVREGACKAGTWFVSECHG